MKKIIKYLLLLILLFLIGSQSVYFKKLSKMKNASAANFDALSFSNKLWNDKLPAKLDSAIEINAFIQAIEMDREAAFYKYSNAMAIGNYRYSLIKVTGNVTRINENDIDISLNHADSLLKIKLATEYVYGNAIRDASGLLDIKEIPKSEDLNNISEALNKIVRKSVLPAFKKEVKVGQMVEIVGAVEINKQYIKLNDLELIPLRIKLLR